MENEKMPHLYQSPIIRLFFRFLKNNNIMMDIAAYKFTFGLTFFIEARNIAEFYLKHTQKQVPESRLIFLRLYWLEMLEKNYKSIKYRFNKPIIYLSPLGHKMTIELPLLSEIRDDIYYLKRFYCLI